MTILLHALVLVPIAFLVMIPFSASKAEDAQGVLKAAVPQAIRLIVGTAILIALMQVFGLTLLP